MIPRKPAIGLIPAGLLILGCAGPPAPPIQITIPEGATLRAAAESLAAHGVVRSATWFRIYARLLFRADDIQAGVYQMRAGMSHPAALAVLTRGRVVLRRLVVPEGLMLTEVAATVASQLGMSSDEFIRATRDRELLLRTRVPGPTLEGYLYPSTYLVRHGGTAAEVVRQMVDEFELHWRPEWNARLDTLKLTRHQLVTLASIVEGEVRFGPDAPYVASVYHNRLRRGMRLQADPTVIYALGRRRRLYEKDYQFRSPFNTYLIDGLPPGPIGQPSEASMRAALYPAQSSFFYLVAQPDGKHVFSRTYREHLEAIRQVRAPRPAAGSGAGSR